MYLLRSRRHGRHLFIYLLLQTLWECSSTAKVNGRCAGRPGDCHHIKTLVVLALMTIT